MGDENIRNAKRLLDHIYSGLEIIDFMSRTEPGKHISVPNYFHHDPSRSTGEEEPVHRRRTAAQIRALAKNSLTSRL